MKLKGLTKLVLAGTALAATAATLTTSTYAWYVTNSKVSATGVAGKVENSAMGSLFIAKDTIESSVHKPGTYVPDIQLEAAGKTDGDWTANDLAVGKYTLDNLVPQSMVTAGKETYYLSSDTEVVANKTYYESDGAATPTYTEVASPTGNPKTSKYYEKTKAGDWVDADGTKVTPTFLTFKFWLTTDAGGDADMTLMVNNTTSSALAQNALSSTGLPTGVQKDTSFTVDAIHALRMRVSKAYSEDTYEELTLTAGTTISGLYELNASNEYVASADTQVQTSKKYFKKYTAGSSELFKTIHVDAIAKNLDGTNYASDKTKAHLDHSINFADNDGNANGYYQDILNKTPYNYSSTETNKELVSTGDSSFGTIHLPAGKNVLLTFEVWLEGSDAGCFDSCRNQDFTFDFSFGLAS